MKIPETNSTIDVQDAFREVWKAIEGLFKKNIDLHGGKFLNVGESSSPGEFLTRREFDRTGPDSIQVSVQSQQGPVNRFRADFSNGTDSTRYLFQDNSGNTYLGVIPNGSSLESGFTAYNDIRPKDCDALKITINGTSSTIDSGVIGTCTALPLNFSINGVIYLSLGIDGNLWLTTGQVLKIGTNQVVGPRGAAVADASGGSVIDVEGRAAINALLSRLRAHGLITT
jgi:hypothetical protein